MGLKQKRLLLQQPFKIFYIKISSNKGSHHAFALGHHQLLFVLVKIIFSKDGIVFYDLQNVYQNK
jgi:hypothetical protein